MSQIPIGWLINRGVSSETPEKQQVSMMIDGITKTSRPLYFSHFRTLLLFNIAMENRHFQWVNPL